MIEKLGAANTDVFLLAWTTTPWTLPGNTGLAVDETADYSIVELEGEGGSHRFVLGQALVSANIKQDHNIVGTIKGSDLVGLGYTPLYDPNEFGSQVRRFVRRPGPGGMVTELEDGGEFAPTVIAADFVSLDDGTGIVHIAPAFGDEDLGVGREKELSFVQPVDLQGIITGNYSFAGKFVKTADKEIMEDLTDRGLLYHQDIYRHTYPFCWRCDTPLLYYAKSSWYIRTSALKDQLVGGNDTINWHPNYIKDGRFGEWLRNNVDWAISRERYWGTPIPIWQCQECDHTICVGGVDELRGMAGANGSLNADGLDLHRPYVDNVVLDCTSESCSGKMHRIPEVMDAWFDSGAMPFAQYHYPFDNESIDTDGRFPADYICEAVDQTRGWFYSLHALSTLLKGQPAYKNVICLGLILDAKGRKMSKRVGNVVEPLSVLDEHGADALRWYLFTASQAGEPRRFSAKLVSETLRKVMLTVWNVYSFFIGYAEIDKFDPSQKPAGWKPENELDRWVLSELNTLISQVEGYMDGYGPTNAGRRIQEFIDQLSNWYVRRSRRRFWRNEGDADKLSGYITLHTCLVTVTKLMAPLAPFVAEEMYQNLVCSVDPSAPDSVHLSEFPVADESLVDQPLMEATQLAMKLASMGRAARSKAGLKVRQPLAKVLVKVRAPAEREYIDQVRPQVLEELNIKDIQVIEDDSPIAKQVLEQAGEETETILSVENYSVSLDGGYMVAVDADISPELAEEGLVREVVHRIQGMRRSANFDVTDRIVTYYQGPTEFADVMQGAFADYIRDETLSTQLVDGSPDKEAATESTKIEGMEITLAVHQV